MSENLRYASVENDTITGVFVCDDPTYAESQGWILIEEMDPIPWMEWTLVDGTWTPPEDA